MKTRGNRNSTGCLWRSIPSPFRDRPRTLDMLVHKLTEWLEANPETSCEILSSTTPSEDDSSGEEDAKVPKLAA